MADESKSIFNQSEEENNLVQFYIDITAGNVKPSTENKKVHALIVEDKTFPS